MLENRVLRRIFGTKKEDIREEWRRLLVEELNDLHFFTNIIRVMK